MATSNTFTKVDLGNGYVLQYGTFTTSSTETTHTVVADVTEQPEIAEVVMWGAASDNDTAVICALDAGASSLKLTFSASDDGDYWMVGKAR